MGRLLGGLGGVRREHRMMCEQMGEGCGFQVAVEVSLSDLQRCMEFLVLIR
jgi:hypothetical protein